MLSQPKIIVWTFYRHIFEEQVAPLVLDVEEEAEDEGEVHDADEHHHHHARVYGHPVSDGALGAGRLVPHLANNNKDHVSFKILPVLIC